MNNLYLDPVTKVLDNSKMADYKRCARYFFFKHILGWKTKYPSVHLVFGAAWHEGHEYFGIHGYEEKNLEGAMNAFLNYYREFFAEATDDDNEKRFGKSPGKARKAYQIYLKDYKDDPYETIYTELGIPVPLGGDRIFHIKLDKISRRKTDGKIIPIDHKTSSRETAHWATQWECRNQFFGYIHGVLCIYDFDEVIGLLVDGTFFYRSSPSKNRRHLIRKSKNQMQAWLANVQYWFDDIQRNVESVKKESSSQGIMHSFPQNDEGCVSYGRLCPFFNECWSSPNPLKHYQTPDDTPREFKCEHWDPRTDPVSNRLDPATGKVIKVIKERPHHEPPAEHKETEAINGSGLLSSIINNKE